MEELHQRFLEQQLPLRYTNLAVEKMLKEKYGAKEIPAASLSNLQNDPQVRHDRIFKCYKIDDKDILHRTFNDSDIMFHEEYKNGRSPDSPQTDWSRIRAGELLRVIIISDDGEYMSSYTVQGICTALVDDLRIMLGIPQGECSLDNEYYVKYLQLLKQRGYV